MMFDLPPSTWYNAPVKTRLIGEGVIMILDGYKMICQCKRCSTHDSIKVGVLELLFFLERTLPTEASIVITSGARCYKHNQEIGGSEKSNHVKRQAIDFTVVYNGKISPELLGDLYDHCKKHKALYPYSNAEVIIYGTFIHIAVRPGANPKFNDKRTR